MFRVTLPSPKENFNLIVTEVIIIIFCFASVQSFTLWDEQQMLHIKAKTINIFWHLIINIAFFF